MGPTIWSELEKAIQVAQENKQSDATISTTCLKNIWRELRNYHRQEGILGHEDDGRVLVTPERAAKLAIGTYISNYDSLNTTFQTRWRSGDDRIYVLATRDNHTVTVSYSFSDIEHNHKVKIVW